MASSVHRNAEAWLVYEVGETHSLWKFAENLGVHKNDINYFLDEMLKDNPRLKKPDLIYPGEKILVRGGLLEVYASKSKVYKTYWAQPKGSKRMPASQLRLALDPEVSNTLFMQPKLGYARIDAKQRSTGAEASLISSAYLGLNTHYSWINSLGTSGVGLELEWVKYDENLGAAINRNQFVSFDLFWKQNYKISNSWDLSGEIGYYQSPYLFTDQGNNLFLKQASQPGLGFGVTKTFASLRTQVNLQMKYLYFGYAGDTVIEDGLGLYYSADHSFKFWDTPLQVGFWANYEQQLSEVTEQSRVGVGLGLGFIW